MKKFKTIKEITKVEYGRFIEIRNEVQWKSVFEICNKVFNTKYTVPNYVKDYFLYLHKTREIFTYGLSTVTKYVENNANNKGNSKYDKWTYEEFIEAIEPYNLSLEDAFDLLEAKFK